MSAAPGIGRAAGDRRARGFTLLEVLVALLLLALALVALVRTTALEARAQSQLFEATWAQWVAANVIAETRLAAAPPAPGERSGHAEMAGRRWSWRMRVSATDESSILRLDVVVSTDEAGAASAGGAVATLTGFVAR